MASYTASSLLSANPHSTKLSRNVVRQIWEITLECESREQWPLVMAEFMGLLDKRTLLVEEKGTAFDDMIWAMYKRVTSWGQGVFSYTTTTTCGPFVVDENGKPEELEELDSRSGRGDIVAVLAWIGTSMEAYVINCRLKPDPQS